MRKKEEPIVSKVIGVALIVMAGLSLLILFDNLPRFLSSGYVIGAPSGQASISAVSVGQLAVPVGGKIPISLYHANKTALAEYKPNEFLVKLAPSVKGLIKNNGRPDDTGIDSLNALNKKHGAAKFEQVAKEGAKSKKDSAVFSWYKVTLAAPGEKVSDNDNEAEKLKTIMRSYKADKNIEAVEPNYIITAIAIPNDPYYSSTGSWGQTYPDLWGIRKINPEPAWDQTTGSTSIIVASIDTGVNRNHPDLAANMWVNTAEIPNNGIDDDGNGYVDDYYGWDFANNDNDPMDDHGHGTHTVGTIAAVGNNGLGVVGVNWNAKVMALKFLTAGGSGTLDGGIKAFQYAADMGARVSSNSWGCGCQSQAIEDAVKYEHDKGMITVAAAGNNNGDALYFLPASADYAITVAASDSNDLKASFSNWGEKIDVAAPGVDILSLKAAVSPMCTDAITVGTNYCRVSGTSMATPHVAGLAALILSKNPSLTNEEVRQIIRQGATDLGTPGKDASFGYGRISTSGSIALADTKPLSPIITSPSSRTLATSVITIVGSVPGPNFKSYKVEVGIGHQPTSWVTLADSTTQVINGVLATVDPKTLPDGLNIIRLTATDTTEKVYQFQVHDIEVDNMDAVISSPYSLVTLGNTAIFGSAVTKNGLAFSNYKLEWGTGSAPTSWSTAGITLANGGTQPVNNSQLGTWDTSSLIPNQQYSLRLTAYSTLSSETAVSTVLLDKDVLNGWPKIIEQDPVGNGDFSQAMPAVADLNGDGNKEIIVAVQNKVYAFRADGSNFPGFPVTTGSSTEQAAGAVNVADLDGDGKQEIVVQFFSYINIYSNNIKVYGSDGALMPGWPKSSHFAWCYNSPTIADLNGDGKKEIVALEDWLNSDSSGYLYTLHAYQFSGEELVGFPKKLVLSQENVFPWFTSFSIADMDGDGKPEMALGFLNRVYLLDNAGNFLPRWPYTSPNQNTTIGPLPVNFKDNLGFGDIDGDGKLELVAFGAAQEQCPSCPAWWFAWKKDGSLVSGFPKNAPKTPGTYDDYLWYTTQPRHAPDLVDINGDGKDEIIGGFYYVIIYDYASNTFTKFNIGGTGGTSVSDIDGDGKFEYTANGNKCCPDSSFPDAVIVNDDGSQYWRKGPVPQFLRPMLVADLNNDGKMELIGYNIPPADVIRPGLLVVWTIPTTGPGPAKYEWPMFGHDPARTGNLFYTPPPPVPDIVPPLTSVTSPLPGSVVKGTVSVAAAASDDIGVAKVEFYVDGVLLATDTSSPYSALWDTTLASDGLHSLTAKAYDAAGNVGTSASVSVTVENNLEKIPPTTSITFPVNGSSISKSITITVSATDNIGVTKVELYRNGALVGTDLLSPYTFAWNTSQSPSGPYVLQSRAYDAASNVGVSPPVTVTVDNTPPNVSITGPSVTTAAAKSTLTITAAATDSTTAITKVEFYVKNALTCTDTTSPYSCTWQVPNAKKKTYTIVAKAYDTAGNTATSPPITITSS